MPYVGEVADFVLLVDNVDIQEVVDRPSYDRITIKGGKMVAKRTSQRWFLA